MCQCRHHSSHVPKHVTPAAGNFVGDNAHRLARGVVRQATGHMISHGHKGQPSGMPWPMYTSSAIWVHEISYSYNKQAMELKPTYNKPDMGQIRLLLVLRDRLIHNKPHSRRNSSTANYGSVWTRLRLPECLKSHILSLSVWTRV